MAVTRIECSSERPTAPGSALPASVRSTLSALADAQRSVREAEARQFELAAHYADVCCEVPVRDDGRILPGMERLVAMGHDGTPEFAEFSCLELAAWLGVAEDTAVALVASAVDVRHRHPALWSAVMACELPVWQARRLASVARELSWQQALELDDEVATFLGSMSFTRLLRWVEGRVRELTDPLLASDARARALASRAVDIRQGDHGVARLEGTVDAADAVFLDATLNRIAGILAEGGNPHDRDVRRAQALGVLASPALALDLLQASLLDSLPELDDECPARGFRTHTCGTVMVDPERLRPEAQLVVHLTDATLRDSADPELPDPRGVVRPERLKPLLVGWLGEVLQGCRVVVKPVIDIPGAVPADSYEIPDRLREAVSQRSPYSVFPFSRRRSRGLQLDHTVPFDPDGPPGQTAQDNLGPLTVRQHRAKTHGGWKVAQVVPGVFVWRSPHGLVALTTPSGTWQLHVPGQRPAAGARPDHEGPPTWLEPLAA